MDIVFFDVEASFVPSKGYIPLTEIALLSFYQDSIQDSIQESFHSLVKPIPFQHEESDKKKFVYEQITGLADSTLHTFGKSEQTIIFLLRHWTNKYKHAIWVARDPLLENRILRQYGITNIVVREILDFVHPQHFSLLYFKKSRPIEAKHWASSFQCSHHDHPSTDHCAMMDIMEEYFWWIHFSSNEKLFEKIEI